MMETVGAATWTHSIKGPTKIYFRQLRVIGSTMGNRTELGRLARFVADRGVEPVVDSVQSLVDARDGFARIVDGEVFGKVVISVS